MEVVRVNRFEVYLIDLNPTQGSEINKMRPCVVISPNELNYHISTVIIAPMTTTQKSYPTRIPLSFAGKKGQIVLDQIRTVDKSRLMKKLGKLKEVEAKEITRVLQAMFA